MRISDWSSDVCSSDLQGRDRLFHPDLEEADPRSALFRLMLRLDVASDVLRLADPLRVAGYSFDTWEVVLATLDDGTHRGRGEASGIYFLGDDAAQDRKSTRLNSSH